MTIAGTYDVVARVPTIDRAPVGYMPRMSTTVVEPSGEAPQAPDNPLGRLDRWQRRHPRIAFIVAVWKKFGDDAAARWSVT
jgi:hypothetical protein